MVGRCGDVDFIGEETGNSRRERHELNSLMVVYGRSSRGIGDVHLTTSAWVSVEIDVINVDSFVPVVGAGGIARSALPALECFFAGKAMESGKIAVGRIRSKLRATR